MSRSEHNIQIQGQIKPEYSYIFSPEALAFLSQLHQQFNPTRIKLLEKRRLRQTELEKGNLPDFLPETQTVRGGDWKVAPAPKDLNDRRVEITGPVERKMIINAMNSGAKVFMADFEDSLSPTWDNIALGQHNLFETVRRSIELKTAEKSYRLKDNTATLVVRPRGWHLSEKNCLIGGEPMSGSLFDFGLYFFHNAKELLKRGSGPYFYLPKMESHLEARLWNEVFAFSQKALGVPHGSVRATVLIETIFAAFEMEEILFELKDHAAGLNAGRWDYIFSVIKKFRNSKEYMLPDRAQITMTVPFMRAYTELLVKSCHTHGAHAIGGMAAFIPNRKDPKVTETALAKVRDDKEREARDGFDGTWVAHPDLVPVAKQVFDQVLGDRPNQKDKLRYEVKTTSKDLINTQISGGQISEAGIRININVAIQYIDHWMAGTGAAALHNLMEDAATAEISRAQLWQWIKHGAKLADGRVFTDSIYRQLRDSELKALEQSSSKNYREATELLDHLVLDSNFEDFLTIPAYRHLT